MSKVIVKRPHRRLVTRRGGEWIRSMLTHFIHGSLDPVSHSPFHPERYLDRFSHFCRAHL